ncbi:MAG: hypothetical protein RIQ71_2584, partial [Verrucomicrobiota bacterium]
MCGIAGFVGSGTRDDLLRMTRQLADRGPDDEGYWEADGVHLGHRRLSILDLEGGAQPMCSADGNQIIVFNGEIYNFAELRKELEAAGHKFRTDHSDTEVLLAAHAVWGDAMVNRLNGMWAFVIYDKTMGRLFGSRDRFGKKPFYYHHSPSRNLFVFASELDALLQHPDVPRDISAAAVRKYFAYGYIPAPLTINAGSCKLPGGHSLSFDLRSGQFRVWRYWEYQPAPEEGVPLGRRVEELRELLRAAVRRRMVADVPLGIFLSGGIDSSLVAALAASELPRGDLQTFSIGFDDASYDELPYAAEVARSIGSVHRTETLSLSAARELLPQIYSGLDEPNGDSSLLPTFLLSKFTRRRVTV